MRTTYLLFSLGLALLAGAQSPITLGNANMPGSGDTLRYTNINLNSLGNYMQTGTNFSWNFSNVVSTTQGVRSFKSSLLTPYAVFFLALNEYGEKVQDTIALGPFMITNYYNFYKKSTSPNAFIADGAGVTFSSVPVPSYYSDKDELYMFPMTYPKYDSTSFRFATPSTTMIPVRYSKTGYRVTVVDGWGTVTTPYGTDNCLRLITTQYSMDTVKTSLGPISLPFGFPNVVRSYQWMTLSSKIPFLEVTGSLTGGIFTPTQARYRGTPGVYTGLEQAATPSGALSLFPNPAGDRLWLDYAGTGALHAELLDMQGRLFKTADLKAGSNSLDISDLAPGLYVIKTGSGTETSTLKFIKH